MTWPLLTLAAYAVYLGTAFVARTVLQYRATGDSGFRGISGRPGSPEWLAGVGFVVALVCGVAGPVAALVDLEPVGALDHTAIAVAGAVVAVAGIAATLWAQGQMGASWRIGVDEAERTELVTTGAFTFARNPIFTAMVATGAGLTLMTPNVVSLVGFVLLVVAIELQVRVVEEPYLLATHAQYGLYAARAGRFVPGVGRIAPRSAASSFEPSAS